MVPVARHSVQRSELLLLFMEDPRRHLDHTHHQGCQLSGRLGRVFLLGF
jgi:hypothetical protein